MIQKIHNTILHEKGWVESRQNHKPVTGLGAQKWCPKTVHNFFFPVTAQNS